MLIRAWNLHLGRAADGRGAHVREMVELLTADRPFIVCLQEVPTWALAQVGDWAGMQAVSVRTRRPKLGPFWLPGAVGRRVGYPGKGNVILLPKDAKVREEKQITLNTNPFCEEQAEKLGLNARDARWWERERRVCQIAKIEFPDRRRWLIANLHATSLPSDRRLANLELGRAVKFIERQAEVEETVVIAGDFNIPLAESGVLQELTSRLDDRFAAVAQGAAQILLRGRISLSGLRIWPDAERTHGGALLSDHAPVEVDVAYRVRRVAPQPEPSLPSLDEAQRAAPLTPPPGTAPPAEPQPPAEAPPPPTIEEREPHV